jgi:AraC-like DNA-binding protein
VTATYLEWPMAEGHRYVACTWAARYASSGEPHVERIPPDGCIDLLWTRRGLEIAGPDTQSFALGSMPGARIVGLRFLPAAAPVFLGVPASALVDCHVSAIDVLGSRATPLIDALYAATTANEAASVLFSHTKTWLQREPDPLVEETIREVRRTIASPSIAELAARLGVSERHLRRRFAESVGYAPKTFQRITRLRRFVAGAARTKRALATLAVDSGYADQSHLNREVRALAGLTPSELVGYPVTLG